MTVRELIELLSHMPPHLQVVVPSHIDAYKVLNHVAKRQVLPIRGTRLFKVTEEGMEEMIILDKVWKEGN